MIALAVLVSVLAGIVLLDCASPTPTAVGFPQPDDSQAAADSVGFEDFAGAAACASCHAQEHGAWSGSTHGIAGGVPGEVRPVHPFDGRPIRFADADVIPEQVAGGQLRFTVVRPGRGAVRYDVAGIVGAARMEGGGTQGYVSRHEDGTVRLLPWERTASGVWFCNTGTRADLGWRPVTPDMSLADCGDWTPRRVLGSHPTLANCQECHGSQIESVAAPGGGRTTRWRSLAIDCEACHGPAGRHVQAARSGTADLAIPAQLGLLDKEASVALCLRCHALKDALAPGYLPGRSLERHYSIGLSALAEDGMLPDGRTRGFAYQEGHLYSACYLNGGMTCTDCHAPHDQTYRSFQERPLAGRFADAQCTSCHPSKAVEQERHTRHVEGSAGSRCVACHMPYLQQPDVGDGVHYGRSDHSISVPRPVLDSVSGIRGACAGCHADLGAAQLAGILLEWHGPPKPLAPPVAVLLNDEDAARLGELLQAAESHPMAALAGLGRALKRAALEQDFALPATTAAALLRAAAERHVDRAGAASALLHLAGGDDPRIRRELVASFSSHPRRELVRQRWIALLGWAGDLLTEAGRPERALNAYGRALELDTLNVPLLRSLGYARLRAGQQQGALAAFRSAVAAAPHDALAHVGLGIALAAAGDGATAASAYRNAAAADPFEPLAHFNLGNVALRADRLDEAVASYERAVALDPSLAAGHFNLARAEIGRGRLEEAARALRAGLEFDAGNRSAADMLAQLDAVVHQR